MEARPTYLDSGSIWKHVEAYGPRACCLVFSPTEGLVQREDGVDEVTEKFQRLPHREVSAQISAEGGSASLARSPKKKLILQRDF